RSRVPGRGRRAADPGQPLPRPEQAAVTRAIAQGAAFLRAAELPTGTWAEPKKPHQVGYAALSALTLLECGVPANDPAILKAASYIRKHTAGLNHTYQLSLTILFLDRLGENSDQNLIRNLPARLIAGQKADGGWHYNCPMLNGQELNDLVVYLHSTRPEPYLITNNPKQPLVPITKNMLDKDLYL